MRRGIFAPAEEFNVYKIAIDATEVNVIAFAGMTDPKRAGYDFCGWSLSKDAGRTEDICFYAVWVKTGDPIRANFDANGGKFAVGACDAGENSEQGNVSTTNPDACFGGFNNAAGSDGAATTPDFSESTDGYTSYKISVKDNTAISLATSGGMAAPTWADHTFQGWATTANAETAISDTSVTVTGDLVYYSVWAEN